MYDQPFVSTLSTADTYRLGEAILVTLEISTQGDQSYQVLMWGTPFEGDGSAADFLTVERDGEILEYDGRLVKRGDPSDEDYATIGPGQSLFGQVDISR